MKNVVIIGGGAAGLMAANTSNEKGNKVCKECTFPHHKDNYGKIIARYGEIKAVVQKMDQEDV